MTNPFQKATRAQLKARVAFAGPTGSGKTWTSLEWATVLANGGRIAVVDTERGSASLYSDHFDFDVMSFEPPYDPGRLVDVLQAADEHGYAVVLVDSLSHFWEGEGGTRDIADAASARSGGNSFAGWKDATPKLRHLIDTMLGLDAHLVATMRSKMEYVIEQNDRGKSVPRKVGMAPVMRQGVEYEFTLVGDIDLDHRIAITKSRCDRLADELVQPGRAAEAAETFAAWLGEGEALAPRHTVEALVGRLNALDDPDARKQAKQDFVARFGRPDDLRATQVAEATAWVDKVVAGPANPVSFPGEGEPAPTDGVNGELTTEGSPPAPPEPVEVDSFLDPSDSPVTRFHDAVKAAAVMLPAGASESDLRHAVISQATHGETEDWRQAHGEPMETATEALTQVAEGTLVLHRTALGWELRLPRDREPAPPLAELRSLIAKVSGLGEGRTLIRAKRLADEHGWPVPRSFDALAEHPDLLAAVVAEVRAEAEGQAA